MQTTWIVSLVLLSISTACAEETDEHSGSGSSNGKSQGNSFAQLALTYEAFDQTVDLLNSTQQFAAEHDLITYGKTCECNSDGLAPNSDSTDAKRDNKNDDSKDSASSSEGFTLQEDELTGCEFTEQTCRHLYSQQKRHIDDVKPLLPQAQQNLVAFTTDEQVKKLVDYLGAAPDKATLRARKLALTATIGALHNRRLMTYEQVKFFAQEIAQNPNLLSPATIDRFNKVWSAQTNNDVQKRLEEHWAEKQIGYITGLDDEGKKWQGPKFTRPTHNINPTARCPTAVKT